MSRGGAIVRHEFAGHSPNAHLVGQRDGNSDGLVGGDFSVHSDVRPLSLKIANLEAATEPQGLVREVLNDRDGRLARLHYMEWIARINVKR